MTTEFWVRIKRLFLKADHSQQLEQVLAGWSADQRPGDFGSAGKREFFHPLKGWMPELSARATGSTHVRRKVRQPADGRTGEK